MPDSDEVVEIFVSATVTDGLNDALRDLPVLNLGNHLDSSFASNLDRVLLDLIEIEDVDDTIVGTGVSCGIGVNKSKAKLLRALAAFNCPGERETSSS